MRIGESIERQNGCSHRAVRAGGKVWIVGIRYVADLAGVRDVTLRGTADLQYWERTLGPRMRPLSTDGVAHILVIAADERFHGIRFQEVSFSVLLEGDPADDGAERAFLFAAFNSRRLFAASERFLFSTPYSHAVIQIELEPPLIEISVGGEVAFRARAGLQSGTEGRAVTFVDTPWHGAVFLPTGNGPSAQGEAKYFMALVSGAGRSVPFTAADQVSLDGDLPFCGALRASQYTGVSWLMRADARHAKSATMRALQQDVLR